MPLSPPLVVGTVHNEPLLSPSALRAASEVVESAPPLTEAQRAELRLILAPSALHNLVPVKAILA
ncbi:hypothetical protein, partial [Arthrobacter rhombi]|uniref:hypothetical protein n=1 Tax=Arthrobacter rhombi TaxID=71253 RepID=UPI003FD2A959